MADETVARLVAATLRDVGVRHVFVYPGDPIIELLESLRASGVEVVLARREGTMAAMAEATAMLTGLPGVCISTLGPGSTAMVGGVANATLDCAPVLALSGQIDRAREQYFTHQVVAHERLYAPVTKWAGHLEPGSAATILRKALRTALAERPGAVHLSINEDVSHQLVTDHASALPPLGPPGAVTAGFSATGLGEGECRRILERARRPVVLAGASIARQGACSALAEFASAWGIPVVVTPMAKGVIDETHDYFAGVLEAACASVVWGLLESADCFIFAGFNGVELLSSWKLRAPSIHLDAVPNTDQIYEADVELVGDVVSSLAWLAERPGEPRWSRAEIAEFRARLRREFESGRVPGHLNPSDVVATVQSASAEDAVCTCDVGSHKLLLGQGWVARAPGRTLITNGLSAMGFAIPAAIAAALAGAPSVYGFVGDGGFAMTLGELGLASELGLPMVVLVFCDQSLNRIELKQQTRDLVPTATRIAAVDVVAIARGLGCEAERAEDVVALEKCLESPPVDRPLVIELPIDPAQYLAQFTRL